MRLLNFLLVLFLCLGFSYLASAQNTTVTGNVVDTSGKAVAGINVTIQGKSTGTVTNNDGSFSISADKNATLIFSGIGYAQQEVPLNGRTNLDIVLRSRENELNAVVVTALGVTRSQKSLVYANQVVSGSELTNVKSDNLMNSLNGKVAGVTISPSTSGVGGSSKVILRGNKNAFGTNQPLYVIDGMPISNAGNANGQPNGTYGGGPDGGD